MLGIWAGTNGRGESAKYWMSVVTEIKNRGVADIFFSVCDRLKDLPDPATTVSPLSTIQTCIIHLIRGAFRQGLVRVFWMVGVGGFHYAASAVVAWWFS